MEIWLKWFSFFNKRGDVLGEFGVNFLCILGNDEQKIVDTNSSWCDSYHDI